VPARQAAPDPEDTSEGNANVILSSRGALALRGIVIAAAVAVIPAVAGCEAGADSATQQWHQPTPGASAMASSLTISNVFVLGAAPATALQPGQSAGLFLALSNTGRPDQLLSISAPGIASSVQLPAGGVRVGTSQSVLLQGPAPRVILEKLTRRLGGGQIVPIVLDFKNAGQVSLRVPVMPRAQYFVTFSPVPATPTASPAATGPHASASSAASNAASAVPTPAPTPTG
jgi:copper(I)-binding protein